ncbi:MAG: peptidase MA family metallohydrolase [Phycisphaerales bacterium JB059]
MAPVRSIVAALFLGASPVCADEEAERSAALAAVGKTLTEMATAVEAADVGGYLAHVSPHDPVFLSEQRAWAADLREHPVAGFELRLVQPEELEVSEHGWAVGELAVRWKVSERRPWKEVRFPARFEPMAGAGLEGGGPWFYAGEHWNIVRDERAGAVNTALALDEQLPVALQIVELMPEVRARVDELFGVENDREQQIKIYPSMQHLQNSIYLSYTEPLGGWNEPGEAIKLLAGDGLRPRGLRRLLAHEYAHAVTFTLGDRATDVDWWILEGIAEHAAELVSGPTDRDDRLVSAWARDGELKRWSQLADFRGEAEAYAIWVYVQGQSMIGYLTDRFGDEARNQWLTMMTRGASLEEATVGVFGVTFAQLDADWHASLEPAPAGPSPVPN